MAFNINDIRSQLAFGGARGNLFQVEIFNRANGAGDFKTPFMVTTTSIPASNLGTINVPYFGRTMKLAGDRTFDQWSVTVMNDEDFIIRNAMEEWSNQINRLQRNVRDLNRYKSNATVTQFGKDGTRLRVYEFNGIFPVQIAGIELDWNPNDAIESFQVTFDYDYWTVVGGVTGNAGGQ